MKKNVRCCYSGSFHYNSWIHFKSLTVLFLILVGWLGFGVISHAASFSPSVLNTASDGSVEVIPLQATVQAAPAKITITTYAPGTFTISRKDPSSNSWGTPIATGVTLAANGTWADSAVVSGSLYEYQFVNTSGTASRSIYPTGYILTGINVDETQAKGRIAVVVASDVPSTLPTEYGSYKNDLRADGWTVHEIQVPRAANYNGGGINGTIGTVTVTAGGTNSIASTQAQGPTDIVILSDTNRLILNTTGSQVAIATLNVNSNSSITSVPILNGGTGFSAGRNLTIIGGPATGSGASLSVVSATQLLGWSLSLDGTGYTATAVTLTGAQSKCIATGTVVLDGNSGISYISNVTSSGKTWVDNENLICRATRAREQEHFSPQ